MAGTIVFKKTAKGDGSRMIGKLTWLSEEYSVVTGGYGKGAIPDGSYNIEVRKVAVGSAKNMESGFINPKTKVGWFIPLTPTFKTSRHGFGVHPDGNLPGTKGCLGLQGDDIKKFWDKWVNTPLSTRPAKLRVVTELEE